MFPKRAPRRVHPALADCVEFSTPPDSHSNQEVRGDVVTSKPGSQPIELSDVKSFLATESDFSFEMRVLNRLIAAAGSYGCRVEHGGTYIDPMGEKRRQFDFRVKYQYDALSLWLAVEAKNLRDSSPLLIHVVKRPVEDAFHEVITVQGPTPTIVRLEGFDSAYRPNDLVGKHSDQVTRKGDGFARSDAPTWDRISQAMNSARDLIEEAPKHGPGRTAVAIVPFLVVPDGLLWQVEYDANGAQQGEPKQIDYCCYYVGSKYEWLDSVYGSLVPPFVISHLEIVTLSALKDHPRAHMERLDGGVLSLGEAIFKRPPKSL